MEIVSPEIILTLFGGIIVTLFAGILRKYFSKYDPQYFVLLVAVLVGGAYMAFKTFLPAELQQTVLSFALGSLSYAVLIYEFVWKRITGEHTTEEAVRVSKLSVSEGDSVETKKFL